MKYSGNIDTLVVAKCFVEFNKDPSVHTVVVFLERNLRVRVTKARPHCGWGSSQTFTTSIGPPSVAERDFLPSARGIPSLPIVLRRPVEH